MPRVDDTAVQAILEVPSGQDTTPFINSAHVIVENNLLGQSLTEETLGQIELWLSAHLAATRWKQAVMERLGPKETQFYGVRGRGKPLAGLDATPYGQQVKLLDSTGILAALAGKQAQFALVPETQWP